jgi:hypothetical protein
MLEEVPVRWQVGNDVAGMHDHGVFTTPAVQFGTSNTTSAVYAPASVALSSTTT